MICSIEGCDLEAIHKNMCSKHYTRVFRYGDPNFSKYTLHGLSKTDEYKVWIGIKKRCKNKNHKRFHQYGGRGISICKEWDDSFLCFLNDMGLKPFPKAQIDRIDNDGNYEPGNCRWVSNAVNSRNRRNNRLSIDEVYQIRMLYFTGNFSQSEIGRIYDVCHSTVKRVADNKIWSF